MAEGMTLEEQGEVGHAFVAGLLDEFGMEGTVETRLLDEDTVEIAAQGEDLGLLVGPRGSDPRPRCRTSRGRSSSASARRAPTGSWWTWPVTVSAARPR